METKKYGDLKDGDRIWFYGNKATVSEVRSPYNMPDGPYAGERVMRFKVTFDSDQELAKWGQYQGGVYGGVEHLVAVMIEDVPEDMNQYKILFTSDVLDITEPIIMEFQRRHFTNREYKDLLVAQLNALILEGHNNVMARVRRNGKLVMSVFCATERDDGYVKAIIYVSRQGKSFEMLDWWIHAE